MSEVYSDLLDSMVDSYSDEWRHECECRWLLSEKSDQSKLNLYLFGVENKDQIVIKDAVGNFRLRSEHARLWKDPNTKPLYAYRGLPSAERLLTDVLKIEALRMAGRSTPSNKELKNET